MFHHSRVITVTVTPLMFHHSRVITVIQSPRYNVSAQWRHHGHSHPVDVSAQSTNCFNSGRADTRLCLTRHYALTQTRHYASTQTRHYASTQTRDYASTQTRHYASAQTRHYASTRSPRRVPLHHRLWSLPPAQCFRGGCGHLNNHNITTSRYPQDTAAADAGAGDGDGDGDAGGLCG